VEHVQRACSSWFELCPIRTPSRRERKALPTRHRVLDAAAELFIRDGYAATTMTAIAEPVDMAVQTLYAAFGTNRAILSELLATRVLGDDEATLLRERSGWKAMEREPVPLCWTRPPR
jgi:AcrR family transcriptional regulator